MAGVRPDYDRVLRQRNALLKSAGAAIKRGGGDVRTLGRLGRAPRDGRRRARRRAGSRWSPISRRTSQRRTPQVTRPPGAGRDLLPVQPASTRTSSTLMGRPAATATGPIASVLAARLLDGDGPAAPGRARPRHHPRRSAPRRPRADARRPAGEGVREPRRVLVVRARAEARVGRAAPLATCGERPGADPRRRVRRARRRPPATGWPSWSAGAEQVLITAAVFDDVPDELAGRAGGRDGPARCAVSSDDPEPAECRRRPRSGDAPEACPRRPRWS